MIRLTKLAEPEILVENAANWTIEYAAWQQGAEGIPAAAETRYKHVQIRDRLKLETSDKCAYCEARIAPVSPEQIEHILPKEARPDLVVNWPNLTLACPRCNSYKGPYYNEAEPLLNPYEQDPADHLVFLCSMVMHIAGSDLGERTTLRLRLSRPDLLQDRARRIRDVHQLYVRWAAAPDGSRKELIAEQLREECGPGGEYSATVKTYLVGMGFPV